MNAALSEPWVERLGWALAHSLWQGLAVAFGLAVVLWMVPRAHANLRYWLSCTAMLTLLACPFATFCRTTPRAQPPAHLGTLTEWPTANSAPPIRPAQEPANTSSASETLTQVPKLANPRPAWNLMPWLTLAWIGGVAVVSLWRLAGWSRARRLRRQGVKEPPREVSEMYRRLFGGRPSALLLESIYAATPMVVGLLRPAILLPTSAITGLPPEHLRAILAHELAHLRRLDHWAILAQTLIETLLFYHPAVWWISRQIRREREMATDDLAIRGGQDRLTYAHALGHLAELTATQPLALHASERPLAQRIRRLLEPPPARASLGWPSAVGIALVLIILAVGVKSVLAAEEILVKPGESIQAAIDSASEGSTIRLAEGVHDERIVLRKPLTLLGAGWDKTIIRPSKSVPGPTRADEDAFDRNYQASDEEERVVLSRNFQRQFHPATILVEGTKGVALRNLQFGVIAPVDVDNRVTDWPTVDLIAEVKMEDCAVLGPSWNGVNVTGPAKVEIQRCLIAASWSTGLRIKKDGATPRVRVVDSEIRNCHHRGVTIGAGCHDVEITRCRISGSAWHGVRYDDCGPMIQDCWIFGNARSGIYASGRTSAKVLGNIFYRNEMGGMSCWFRNGDQIEGNTFIENAMEALSLLGQSAPIVRRNIFAGSPVGVGQGKIAEDGPSAQTLGELSLTENLFWNSDAPLQREGAAAAFPPESKSRFENPKFRDSINMDVSLAPDSPALSAGIGAAKPIALASPWALTEAERSIIPAGLGRDYQSWLKPGKQSSPRNLQAESIQAYQRSLPWIKGALQIDDPAKRKTSIEAIRSALESPDEAQVRAGLAGFMAITEVVFDKKSFRPVILKLLQSKNIGIRLEAARALPFAEKQPGDLDMFLSWIGADENSLEVNAAITGILAANVGDDFTGKAGDAVLRLLAYEDREFRKNVIHPLSGKRFSRALEHRLVELCRLPNGNLDSEIIAYALGPQANKGESCIRLLLDAIPQRGDTSQVISGLGRGVPIELQPMVADALLTLLEAREISGYEESLRVLERYATANHLARIEALASRSGLSERAKDALGKTLGEIQRRVQPAKPTATDYLVSAQARLALLQWEEAIAAVEAAKRLGPDAATLSRLAIILGDAASGQGKFAEAAERYAEALNGQDAAVALAKRVAALRGAGKVEEAAEELKRLSGKLAPF